MQATSAASERSFLKAILIVVARRMVTSPFHVDNLHLVGWGIAESDWATQRKEKRAKLVARKKRKTHQKKKR